MKIKSKTNPKIKVEMTIKEAIDIINSFLEYHSFTKREKLIGWAGVDPIETFITNLNKEANKYEN